MKVFSSLELAEYIKQRQLHQVRGIRQAQSVQPCLAVVVVGGSKKETILLEQAYGEDITFEVRVIDCHAKDLPKLVDELNEDKSVHGILVKASNIDQQLKDIASGIAPKKDIAGMGSSDTYQQPVAQAVNWLLTGYNIGISGAVACVVGQSSVSTLAIVKVLEQMGGKVEMCQDIDLAARKIKNANLIVITAGREKSIKDVTIPVGCTVVDASYSPIVTQQSNIIAEEVYSREDIKITPKEEGIAPLVEAVIFENTIISALL